MQKVSKQSLAMLALSILLAISIALTLTFAALNTSKTATGTITFSGEVGLIYSGLTSGTDANDVTFTITYSSEGNPTLATEAATDLNSVVLKMANTCLLYNQALMNIIGRIHKAKPFSCFLNYRHHLFFSYLQKIHYKILLHSD